MLVVSVRGLKGDRFVALLGTVRRAGCPRRRDASTNSASKLAASRLILYDAILGRFMKNKVHKKRG